MFIVKYKVDGTVEQYKANLVAKAHLWVVNDELEEEVSMEFSPSFEESFGKGKVCKLKRSLYMALTSHQELSLISSPRLSEGLDILKAMVIIRCFLNIQLKRKSLYFLCT